MTHTQAPSGNRHDQTLAARVKALPLAVKITSGVAVLVLLGGGITALALNDTSSEKVAAIASPTATNSSTATLRPTAKASSSAAATKQGTPKATATPAPNSPAEQPRADVASGIEEQAPAGGANSQHVAEEAPLPAAQAPAPAAPAPAPAPPPPPPAPKPVAPAPPPPPPAVTPQSLASINAARVANGVAGFVPWNAGCSAKATAWGTSLDGYEGAIQHTGVVLGVYGNTTGATFDADNSVGGRSGTLTVYRCS